MDAFVKVKLDRVSKLVELIYQAATDPIVWKQILPALGNYMDSSKAMLHTPTTSIDQGGCYYNYGISDFDCEQWRTRYRPRDIWLLSGIANSCFVDGNIFIGEEIVSREDLLNTPIYKDFLFPIGIGQVITIVIFGVDSKISPFTSISFFRGVEDKAYDNNDKYKLSLLLPHISRALGLTVSLRNSENKLALTLTELDQLNSGIILLNEYAEITFLNKVALRLIIEEDGLKLKNISMSHYPSLFTSDKKLQQKLDESIQEVIKSNKFITSHFSKSTIINRTSGGGSYKLNFSPLPPVEGFAVSYHPPKAIIFISDQNSYIKVNYDLLKNVYGLTKTEIKVVQYLSFGNTLDELSQSYQVSVNTLKTHLKHIYCKTNTNNRIELLRLLIGINDV